MVVPIVNRTTFTHMIQKETHEESCEYHIQPQMIFKTFTATLYETEQVSQDVNVYPLHLDGSVLDVEIRAMILVKPQSIREDVENALWSEYRLTLGDLRFTPTPTNETIHP